LENGTRPIAELTATVFFGATAHPLRVHRAALSSNFPN